MTTEKPLLTATAMSGVDQLVASSNQLSNSLRIKFFITGVILPTWCLLLIWLTGIEPTVNKPWQSGHHSDYLAVLLSAPTILYFLPLIVFSKICLAIWCFRPKRFSTFPTLVGLYSGALLTLMFLALLFPLTFIISEIAGIIAAVLLAVSVFLIQRAFRRLTRFKIAHMFALAFVVAILIPLIQFFELWQRIPYFIGFVHLAMLAGSPTLAFATFLRASIFATNLRKQTQPKRPKWVYAVLPISWLTIFIVTWRYAIESMMLEYSNLPTSDPNCYVSAAAANGHRRLVGSTTNKNDNCKINWQMKRLKFLEFALRAIAPKLHGAVRRFYNRSGPKAAKILRQSKWLADFAFLTLKPLEWLAIAVQVVTRVSNRQINNIYARIP